MSTWRSLDWEELVGEADGLGRDTLTNNMVPDCGVSGEGFGELPCKNAWVTQGWEPLLQMIRNLDLGALSVSLSFPGGPWNNLIVSTL